MVAAVYVVGGPTDDDRDDLRHSLRSLANAPWVDEVWIAGDVPAWVCHAVRVPLEPLADKFQNQRQSLTRFLNYPGAPGAFYLFNDDMFITEPIDGVLPTCRNKNRLSAWLAAEQADGRTPNQWHQAVVTTGQWVAEQTGTDPLIYEAHTPLMFHTGKLRDAINAYPANLLFAVGELYPLAGAHGEGEHRGNAKCGRADSLQHKLDLDMPYLSGNPDTWPGPLGQHIRAMFPNPCRYEEA